MLQEASDMTIGCMDSEFNIIESDIVYINLQWNRKYYSVGDFSVQLPASLWNSETAYIYCRGRDEVGLVQKVAYSQSGNTNYVQVSGYFAEALLDDAIIYPRFTKGFATTDTCIRYMFANYCSDIPISVGGPSDLGDETKRDVEGEYLGSNIYKACVAHNISIRVKFNDTLDRLELVTWEGLDRTQDQDVNPRYAMGDTIGNIESSSVTTDTSGYKNYAKVVASDGATVVIVDKTNGELKKVLYVDEGSSTQSDEQTAAEFEAALYEIGEEQLNEHQAINEVTLTLTGEDYMSGWDLGDTLDVILEYANYSDTTQVTEVAEVVKAGVHSITPTLGKAATSIL